MVMMSFCPGNRYSARNFGLGSFTEEVSRRSSKLFIFPSSVTKKSITDLSSSFFKKTPSAKKSGFRRKGLHPKLKYSLFPLSAVLLERFNNVPKYVALPQTVLKHFFFRVSFAVKLEQPLRDRILLLALSAVKFVSRIPKLGGRVMTPSARS